MPQQTPNAAGVRTQDRPIPNRFIRRGLACATGAVASRLGAKVSEWRRRCRWSRIPKWVTTPELLVGNMGERYMEKRGETEEHGLGSPS